MFPPLGSLVAQFVLDKIESGPAAPRAPVAPINSPAAIIRTKSFRPNLYAKRVTDDQLTGLGVQLFGQVENLTALTSPYDQRVFKLGE